MFAVATHRLLLVCLALLIAVLSGQPRGTESMALPGVAVTPVVAGEITDQDGSRDPVHSETSSLIVMPDLPDDTHAAVLWSWSSLRPPHALVHAMPMSRYDARIDRLLRPPSA